MIIVFLILIVFVCNAVNAQEFVHTDNLLLSEITKKKYYRCYMKSRNTGLEFVDGKKLSPKMDFLIGVPVIKKQIEDVWGDNYNDYEEFGWGYYEFKNNVYYKYLVNVDQPINPIGYLLKEDLQVDSVTIPGAGILTTGNIYFTMRVFDSDETVHLNWYSIIQNKVEHIAELIDNSYEFYTLSDPVLPDIFTDDNGNYYFAIENKQTHKRKYYIIKLRNV